MNVDLPVPRGPKRKKLVFGGRKNRLIISKLRLKMEFLIPFYHILDIWSSPLNHSPLNCGIDKERPHGQEGLSFAGDRDN